MVYVANVPSEAAPSSDSDDVDDDDGEPKQASESAEAISKVALAHADKVVGIERDYGVPAVVGCLRNPEGRIALGAAVRCLPVIGAAVDVVVAVVSLLLMLL